MKKCFRLLLLSAVFFGLAGCATSYRLEADQTESVKAIDADGQVASSMVQLNVNPANEPNVTFDMVLVEVTFENKSAQPISFGPANFSGTLAENKLTPLSYDERLKKIQRQLDRLNQRYGSVNYGVFGGISRGNFGFGINLGNLDNFLDASDRQKAIDSLERVIEKGLQATVVQPGQMVTGEVALVYDAELEKRVKYPVSLVVKVLTEDYPFKLTINAK